ncbi:MAG: ABC transporter permease subunit [Acetatifactor sp.]|nr:ABC transporter permease subunit [Acetatifactor sp.]
MSRLLRAGFVRLWKSKIFWWCLIFLVFMEIMAFNANVMTSSSVTSDETGRFEETVTYIKYMDLEDVVFMIMPYFGFVISVFVSLYMGTEYEDGTMRNKVIAGHNRTSIYLAETIVCTVAAVFLCIVTIAVSALIDLVWGSELGIGVWILLRMVFASVLIAVACSGIALSTVAWMQQGKSALVINLVIFFLMLFLGMWIDSRLGEKEYLHSRWRISEEGEVIENKTPNPNYVWNPAERAAMEFVEDIFPVGQGIQLASVELARIERWPAFALGVTVATTGIGVFLFRKKDIR